MAHYFLECDHPHVVDTDTDPDEEYLEIIYQKEKHTLPANINTEEDALTWVASHKITPVKLMNREAFPKPTRLLAIIKDFS